MYTVKARSHRGVVIVSEHTTLKEAMQSLFREQRLAVVMNDSRRVLATNVKASF